MHIHFDHKLTDEDIESLEAHGSGWRITSGEHEPADADLLVAGTPTAEELDRIPGLRYLIVPWAGVSERTLTLLRDRRAITCYNLHHNASATAETALALLFSVTRRIVVLDQSMRQGSWSPRYTGSGTRQLAGKSAVVVGYGEIGKKVAHVLSALGMTVTGVRRRDGSDQDGAVRVESVGRLHEIIGNYDAVILALPLTKETELLFSAEMISEMKENSVFVNVARGGIVDEAALFEAVQSERLFGAGFDVWWKYPASGEEDNSPVGEFPWHELPNVVMSPHVGGTSEENEEMRRQGVMEIIRRLSRGDESLKAVNVDLGY